MADPRDLRDTDAAPLEPRPAPASAGLSGYDATTYGEAFADVYDDWYADISPVEATVAFVAARATGPVLEVGCGTGRLTAPMAAAGLAVVGLDASAAMARRAQAQAPTVPVVRADMVEPPLAPRSFGAVVIAFNTLFNLESIADQRRTLARLAGLLRDDGVLVVEAFVPAVRPADDPAEASAQLDDTPLAWDDRVEVVRLTSDAVVLRVSRSDEATGRVQGAHVELRDGDPVRVRPWSVRYRSPDQLDDLADRAGLELAERHGGWSGEPFDEGAARHVTVYQRRRARR